MLLEGEWRSMICSQILVKEWWYFYFWYHDTIKPNLSIVHILIRSRNQKKNINLSQNRDWIKTTIPICQEWFEGYVLSVWCLSAYISSHVWGFLYHFLSVDIAVMKRKKEEEKEGEGEVFFGYAVITHRVLCWLLLAAPCIIMLTKGDLFSGAYNWSNKKR